MKDRITIRMRLAQRIVSAFAEELRNDNCKIAYDEEFLLRMGKASRHISRLVDKMLIFMCAFDVLILILISGHSINIQAFGIKVSDISGMLEIVTFIASIFFLLLTMNLIESQIYDSLIRIALKDKFPECNPSYMMASLGIFNFFKDMFYPDSSSFIESSLFHKITYYIMRIMTMSLVVSLFCFHITAIYISIHYMTELELFGTSTSNLISLALFIINGIGVLYLFMANLYPFKFGVVVSRDS